MLKQGNRLVALLTLVVLTVTMLGAVSVKPAHALGKNGWRNATIGAGAVTAYGLWKRKRTLAIVGGVGTVYSYSRYRRAKKAESRRRQAWYRQRYGRNWRSHYYRRG